MPVMKNRILLLGFSIAILFLAAAGTLCIRLDRPVSAAQAEDARTIQALLSEVHQLRVVLQRGNLNTYRAQIAVERMRMQQEQLVNTRRDLEATRTQLLNSKRFHTEAEGRIKELEAQANQEQDPTRRAMLDRQFRESKRNFDGQIQWEDALREKETQLANQQLLEQSKLTELVDRLEALERELEKPQPTDNQGK
jgi:hypothetical protein